MTKRKAYVIVLAIWLVSFLLSFVSFLDRRVNSTNEENITCGAIILKTFGLEVVTLPLFLSAMHVCGDSKHLPLLCCGKDYHKEW